MKVEVELEDLETLIFATAAIKQIEDILARRHKDPFVKPHLPGSEAISNLTAAMNGARRAHAGTAIAWDAELTVQEAALLKDLADMFDRTSTYFTADVRLKDKRIDNLACKGCVQIGQSVQGAIWAGDTRPELKAAPHFQVRITQRGRDKLQAYESKREKKDAELVISQEEKTGRGDGTGTF